MSQAQPSKTGSISRGRGALAVVRAWLGGGVSGVDGLVDVVPASAADAMAMRELVRAAYEQYVPRIGREPAPMTADYGEVARSGRALLAKIDSSLVGVLVTELEEDCLLVDNVAVDPRWQGSGIGSLLLGWAEGLAREAGKPAVRLFTNEAMTENLVYYSRKGFVEFGRAQQDGFHRVFFKKVLPR